MTDEDVIAKIKTANLPTVNADLRKAELRRALAQHSVFTPKSKTFNFFNFNNRYLYLGFLTTASVLIALIIGINIISHNKRNITNISPITLTPSESTPVNTPLLNPTTKSFIELPTLPTPNSYGKWGYQYINRTYFNYDGSIDNSDIEQNWSSTNGNLNTLDIHQDKSGSYTSIIGYIAGKTITCGNCTKLIFTPLPTANYWDKAKLYSGADAKLVYSLDKYIPAGQKLTEDLLIKPDNLSTSDWINKLNSTKYTKYLGTIVIYNTTLYGVSHLEQQLDNIARVTQYQTLDHQGLVMYRQEFRYHQGKELETLSEIKIAEYTNIDPDLNLPVTILKR